MSTLRPVRCSSGTGVEPLAGIESLERVRRALIERWRMDGTLDRPRMSAPTIPKRLHIVTGGKPPFLTWRGSSRIVA